MIDENEMALKGLNSINQDLSSKLDQLRRANSDLGNLFESTQMATVVVDRFMLIRSYTPAVTAIFNLICADRGRPITDIAHQLENIDLRADIREVLDERTTVERTVRLRESKIFHLMRIFPYRISGDVGEGALVTFVDVTAVVAAEEQQRLLVAELNHRVRNMLQVVIGLAHQTLHRSDSLGVFEKSFMGRMQALARAYELLSRDGWSNAPIEELLRSQLGPFATEAHRYTCSGRHIMLNANSALALGLVVYELATNATKYGALSVPTGHLDVSWELTRDAQGKQNLVLSWRESGGPAVEPPRRQGFGTELLHRQLHYELSGRASMNFAPSGLQVMLAIPADNVVMEAEPEVRQPNP